MNLDGKSNGDDKVDTLKNFLEDEINSQELYEYIIGFITSFHVRNGEFEGNRFIIKKMDQMNFILFPEDIYQDGSRGISYASSIYRHDLLKAINNYAPTKGIKIIDAK